MLGFLASALVFFIFSVVIFATIEVYPTLARTLGLAQADYDGYYALRERYVPDDRLVMRIRPGYEVGSRKYDTDGFLNDKTAEYVDAVLLGDSQMEIGAYHRGLTFPQIFERASGLTVRNLGLGWWGPMQYLEAFKRFGLQLKPKLALFNLNEHNDLTDIDQYLRWQSGGRYYHFVLSERNLGTRYLLAVDSFYVAFLSALSNVGITAPRPLRSLSYRKYFLSDDKKSIDTNRAYVALARTLSAFRDICRDRGIQPVLVFIPSKGRMLAAVKGEVPPSELEIMYVEMAKRLDMPVVTLTAKFGERMASGDRLYDNTDHWSASGRRVAAEVLVDFLRGLPLPLPQPATR